MHDRAYIRLADIRPVYIYLICIDQKEPLLGKELASHSTT